MRFPGRRAITIAVEWAKHEWLGCDFRVPLFPGVAQAMSGGKRQVDQACPAASESRIGSTFSLAKARRHLVSCSESNSKGSSAGPDSQAFS